MATVVLSRVMLVLAGILLGLLGGEVALRVRPPSHSIVYTATGSAWLRRCWHLDERGYREHPPARAGASGTLLVVGDSFTAGAGLCDTRQRFGNILAEMRPEYRVYVLGVSGSNTREHLRRLREFPVRPDVIVLAYFGNDIDDVAEDVGYRQVEVHPYADVPSAARPLVRWSHLLNYVYWLWPHDELNATLDYYNTVWSDERVVQRHLEDLKEFQAFGVPLVVVVIPYLPNLDWSRKLYVNRVMDHFRTLEIPVLDVSTLVEDLPVFRRVVNAGDPHASAEVNRRIAAAVSQLIPPAETSAIPSKGP